MENTEKYTYTVDYGPEKPEKEKHSLTPSESVFFDELKNNLKKYAADMTAPNPQETLCENFDRLHRLLSPSGVPLLPIARSYKKPVHGTLPMLTPEKTKLTPC